MGELADLIGEALAGVDLLEFVSATLVRVEPGTRGATLSDGNNPTSTSYSCRIQKGVSRSAYWQFWQNAQLNGAQARTTFVGFSILGSTLPAGITPRAGDRIVHSGKTYTIAADGVTDPGLGVVWQCMCRAPGG